MTRREARRLALLVVLQELSASLDTSDEWARHIARLANKARASKTGRVTALDGAVRVRVERVRR